MPAKILVVRDEPTVCSLIRLHLEAAGFDVLTARDGAVGLHHAFSERPALVLTAFSLPALDGPQLLAALRANPDTEAIPVIVLLPGADRATQRRAMAAGADDVLQEPVDGLEIVEAVRARFARLRAIRNAAEREHAARVVADAVTTRLAVAETAASAVVPPVPMLPEVPAIDTATLERGVTVAFVEPAAPMTSTAPLVPALPPGRRVVGREPRSGTLMLIAVRNALAMAHGCNATARRDTLQTFFSRLCEPILAQFGWVVRHSAHEVVALFESAPDEPPDHAARALRAALMVVLAAHRFRLELRARSAGGPVADFSLGVALDSGEVELLSLDGPAGLESMITGRMAEALGQVDSAVRADGWSVAARDITARAGAPEFVIGRTTALVLGPGTEATTFAEVIGFDPRATADGDIPRFHSAVADAIRVNSALADAAAQAEAAAGELDPAALLRIATQPRAALEVPGYHVVRRLGAGGMSRVYLAVHAASGAEHVLKVVPLNEDEELLQRFIQEYALIAQVRHPNVATIYGQGFGPSCAYISMEMLAGGDLRERIDGGMPLEQALRHLSEAAFALEAIHAQGIIHRDLKPENLMFRADGSAAGTLVLADFGIAKQIETSMTKTRHGEVYGTPFYMSPEQARGLAVDGRSDLYSLGVIFHEMLTGAKPFTAGLAEALVYQHLHSDIPTLPGHLWRVQPILDRLLAKDPENRYRSARDLLDAIVALGATTGRSGNGRDTAPVAAAGG